MVKMWPICSSSELYILEDIVRFPKNWVLGSSICIKYLHQGPHTLVGLFSSSIFLKVKNLLNVSLIPVFSDNLSDALEKLKLASMGSAIDSVESCLDCLLKALANSSE